MAIPPEITNLTFLCFLLFPFPISSLNITDILSPYAQFSDFASRLAAVGPDLASRSSITLLAVPNDHIPSVVPSSALLPDTLRFHVLLEYLSLTDLRRIPPAGRIVTTLFQATGRAAGNSGAINITYSSSTDTVAFHSLSTTSTATMLPLTQTLVPNQNVSILPINSLLIPYDPDLTASATRLPQGINITKQLIDGQNFNVVAAMLTGSGVISQFEASEGGAGLTLFVPTDGAFNDLPPHAAIKSMSADMKSVVLKSHVLHSYYPLGSLQSIVNPVYPTLATEENGAGQFTVNISRVNGSVGIDTGLVLASITQTVFDQNPVSIFGVSRVLLPKEYFGGVELLASDLQTDDAPPTSESPPGPEAAGPSSAVAVGKRRILVDWGFTVGVWCLLLV